MSETSEDDGILSALIGHKGAKAIIRSALRRGDVDLHLSGPPASGKSVVLLAVEEHIDGAKYVDAKGVSERQLRDILKDDPPLLLIDEFDNMPSDAYKALNTAMEQGRVTKSVTGDSYDVEIDTQVLAASNSLDAVPDDVSDRFVEVAFDPYTRAEFIDVCGELLPRQVGWIGDADRPEHVAREVAKIVWDETGSKSPRTARDAALLSDSAKRVGSIVEAMDDPKADVESEPLHPDDLPHNRDGRGGKGSKDVEGERDGMAKPSDVGEKSVKEVADIMERAMDGDTGDEPTSENAKTSGREESSGAKKPEREEENTNAEEFIAQMVREGEQVIQNQYDMASIGIVIPKAYEPELSTYVMENQTMPGADPLMIQDPSFAEFYPNASEELESIQFTLSDPGDLKSDGYDIAGIIDELESNDIPFLVTKSPTVQATIPV